MIFSIVTSGFWPGDMLDIDDIDIVSIGIEEEDWEVFPLSLFYYYLFI